MTAVRRQRKPIENSPVTYLVPRDLLSIEIHPTANPRLVMIPAHSIVELKGTSPVPGFTELIWEDRTHMIFEADLMRLNSHVSRVNSFPSES